MPMKRVAEAAAQIRIEDVEFVRHDSGGLLARIYHPVGDGPFPAAVEVHGGVWISNDRFRSAAIATELAARGTLIMSIDFRMPPQASYPASLSDISSAIVWLKAHAPELKVDPRRIGTLGFSSGGHQVLLLGLRPDFPKYAPVADVANFDASVAFVVAAWPIVDPIQRYGMAKQKGRADLIRGHDLYWQTEAAMAEGNPQFILDRDEQSSLPAALLIQGTADDNIDHHTAEPFAEEYRKRGGMIAVCKFEGAGHGFIRDDLTTPDAARAVDLIDTFIRRPENFSPFADAKS